MTTNLLTLTLCLTALAACGGDPGDAGTIDVVEGVAAVSMAGGTDDPNEFPNGATATAGWEAATVVVSIGGKARATIAMAPGAVLSRRASNAFDLAAGTIAVETSGLDDRVLVYHADCYVEAGRAAAGDVKFTATAVGKQIAVLSEKGTVQLNAVGATPMDLNYAMLGPGEQGLAKKGAKPVKVHVDDAPAGPYLTPRLSLTADAATTGLLRLDVKIEAGESGAFHGLPVASEDPPSLLLLASGAGDREIPILAAHVRAGASLPPSVLAKEGVAFELPFDVPSTDLAPGVWTLRVRYTSHGGDGAGLEWVGAVESEPVTVTIE